LSAYLYAAYLKSIGGGKLQKSHVQIEPGIAFGPFSQKSRSFVLIPGGGRKKQDPLINTRDAYGVIYMNRENQATAVQDYLFGKNPV
jgi:hypothetical protein